MMMTSSSPTPALWPTALLTFLCLLAAVFLLRTREPRLHSCWWHFALAALAAAMIYYGVFVFALCPPAALMRPAAVWVEETEAALFWAPRTQHRDAVTPFVLRDELEE